MKTSSNPDKIQHHYQIKGDGWIGHFNRTTSNIIYRVAIRWTPAGKKKRRRLKLTWGKWKKKRVSLVGPARQHWNTYVTALWATLARRELCIHVGREIPLPNREPPNTDRFWIPHIFLRIFFTSTSARLILPAHSSARTYIENKWHR